MKRNRETFNDINSKDGKRMNPDCLDAKFNGKNFQRDCPPVKDASERKKMYNDWRETSVKTPVSEDRKRSDETHNRRNGIQSFNAKPGDFMLVLEATKCLQELTFK